MVAIYRGPEEHAAVDQKVPAPSLPQAEAAAWDVVDLVAGAAVAEEVSLLEGEAEEARKSTKRRAWT
jgi:hypothetical protein